MDHQAEILQQLSKAIDAKCRLQDNYQMFRCLENALGYEQTIRMHREALGHILFGGSSDAGDYVADLERISRVLTTFK